MAELRERRLGIANPNSAMLVPAQLQATYEAAMTQAPQEED